MWSFGDGTAGTGRVYTKTYKAAGNYMVNLTVTDNSGLSSMTSKVVSVSAPPPPPNKPPVAAFASSPAAPTTATPITFDASASNDPDGTIASYSWTFGDRTAGSGKKATKSYSRAGTYAVVLTVTDNKGAKGSVSKPVVVSQLPANKPPVAKFTFSPYNPTTSTSITFDASSSSDPDGTIASYSWSFGDGTMGSGKTLTKSYSGAGTYTVTLTVADNKGAKGSVSNAVNVLEPPRPWIPPWTLWRTERSLLPWEQPSQPSAPQTGQQEGYDQPAARKLPGGRGYYVE